MSVLGISLGSHSVYVSVYNTETSTAEVLCDDLGYWSIPSVVAFRAGSGDAHSVSSGGAEVLVGHAAKQQQAKNPANTFIDICGMIFDGEVENVFIPLLEKEISIEDLVSHLFSHVSNQVKQQTVLKQAIKESYLCLPAGLSDERLAVGKERLINGAKNGGLCIKGFCPEGASPLIALALDSRDPVVNPPVPLAVAAVVDMGWSKTSVSFYNVSNGIFCPLYSNVDTTINAKTFNDNLVKFCIKDFARRAKVDCSDSKRSITRLALQCEHGIKILINSHETTIVVDSLFEGMDYAGKISRSRFEDLCSMTAMALKNFLKLSLEAAHLGTGETVSHVLLAGGGGALPFVHTLVRQMFAQAIFPKNRYDSVELGCAGAAIHGGTAVQTHEANVDTAAVVPQYDAVTDDIVLCESKEITADNCMVLFPKNTILPCAECISLTTAGKACEFFVYRSGDAPGAYELLGEVCFDAQADMSPVEFSLASSETGSVGLSISLAGENASAGPSFFIPLSA